MRIRLVEDTPEIAVWLKQALEMHDVDFQIVTTTREFERLLSPAPWEDIDVAVVDVMLPGVSGLDIARYLGEVHPGIRVVIMTASLPSADEATGVAHAVIVKPFSSQYMVAAIQGGRP